MDNKTVLLNWQTASETNNDFFTLERSLYSNIWEDIDGIDGAGNSSNLLDYSTIDKQPYKGVSYYRLKQTDFDGRFEYSEIKRVDIKSENNIEIFPNPVRNFITIVGKEIDLMGLSIYNALGLNVTNLTQQDSGNRGQLTIDVTKLSSGIYHMKTKTTVNKVYKQ